jgi:hypothetical protein
LLISQSNWNRIQIFYWLVVRIFSTRAIIKLEIDLINLKPVFFTLIGPNPYMKHILIAEDHAVVRIGTKHLLKSLIPDSTISDVDDFDKILQELEVKAYDLLILDINIPGGNTTKWWKPSVSNRQVSEF